uniref:Guanine nucleotide-binding protein subunit alpha-14 n=1 Tax=Schistosoma haematobium TaxID=6185 RepID=A0A094ZLZ6_SCHHA
MKQSSKAVRESLITIGSITLRCLNDRGQNELTTCKIITEYKIQMKAMKSLNNYKINIKTINLGEHSEHLNKQFHYFESVNMILFFISLEDVYRFTYVQGNKFVNHQTFKLFEDIVNSPDLTKKDILVFLNKYDILKSIISQINNDTTQITINKEDDKTDWNIFIQMIKSYLIELHNHANMKGSHLYFHIICSLDIDKMKWIIKDSIRTILEINRKRHLIF